MPSDDRAARALQALSAPRERWTSAVAAAAEEVRAFLAAHRPLPHGQPAERARVELGAFAAGRIDAARFGALFGGGAPLDPASVARVERALGELTQLAAAGDLPFRVDVATGADLRLAVSHALGFAGRAFGAAQVVELIRSGRFREDVHGALLDGLPFRRWNRAERQIAPPLVVEVDGADLHAGSLADFVDGTMKIVLLVRGACPPAPLVRLVTPGVLVMQAAGAAELDRLAAFPGPAVAALVPQGAARFVHDPAGGPALHQRLRIHFAPDADALAPVGGTTVFQQREELALLRELAAAPAPIRMASAEPASAEPASNGSAEPASAESPAAGSASASGTGPPATGHPAPGTAGSDVDRLASWLLRQAELG
ncbi:MAG TPA: hypothetical protein VF142_06655 [Longimicrobium sp.]